MRLKRSFTGKMEGTNREGWEHCRMHGTLAFTITKVNFHQEPLLRRHELTFMKSMCCEPFSEHWPSLFLNLQEAVGGTFTCGSPAILIGYLPVTTFPS